MSDSAARTIAAAIVLASVVAAVGLGLSRRQHRESLLFDCLAQMRGQLWLIGEELGSDSRAFHGCRALMREVTK